MPAHFAVATGISAERLAVGITQQTYRGSRRTLAEVFRESGYFTSAVLSNPFLNPGSGFAHGFGHFRYPENDLNLCRTSIGFLFKMIPNAAVPVCRLTAEEVTDHAIGQIRTLRRPYFLTLNYMEPHLPHYVPRRFRPVGYKPFQPVIEYPLLDQAIRGGQLFSTERAANLERNYRLAIRYLDSELGRLFQAVDDSSDGGETIVALVGDHGEQFGEHGHWLHATSVYRQVLRVPLAIRGPGMPAKSEEMPVSTIDLYGTLLHLTGNTRARLPVLPSVNVPGPQSPVVSLHEPFPQHDSPGDAPAVSQWSIVQSRFHYLRKSPEQDELYDTVSDPNELHNLVEDSALQELRQTLAELVERLDRSRLPLVDENRRKLSSAGYLR